MSKGRKIRIERLDDGAELWWGMVMMSQGELNERMMDTTISICEVKPSNGEGFVFRSCLLKNGCKLGVVLSTPWYSSQKCFLYRSINIAIGKHVL